LTCINKGDELSGFRRAASLRAFTFTRQPTTRLQQGTVIVAHACHAVDEKTRCLKGSGRDGIRKAV